MISLLGVLILYLLINLVLLGCGIGIGFLLRWIFPAVDLGTGILTGVVTTSVSLVFLTRLLRLVDKVELEEGEADDDDNEAVEEYEARHNRRFIYAVTPPSSSSSRGRKRKRRR